LKLFSTLAYYSVTVKPDSFVVVQYPLLGVNPFFKYYIKLLKQKGCRFCCIIHDLDTLRSDYDKRKIEKEIDALAAYDAVISHNPAMTAWLRANGYRGHIEEIVLFDYLAPTVTLKENRSSHGNHEIAFAGNLARGNFLPKLARADNSFYLNLYGQGFPKSISENNAKIRWYGSFSPEEIIDEVAGDFGLIWDGDSTEEITGLMGNYIRYNTPHKTSLYLAAGLPVIISGNAAIADFIRSNNIGVCINSLAEISTRALGKDEEEYKKMKQNARQIGEKLRKGEYLKNALIKTRNFLEKNK
jgi:hypothetical protein